MDRLIRPAESDLPATTGSATPFGGARTVLCDPAPVQVRDARAMIAAFVLQLPTGREDKPGTVGDYLGAYDFEVAFNKLAHRDIEYAVSAHPGRHRRIGRQKISTCPGN